MCLSAADVHQMHQYTPILLRRHEALVHMQVMASTVGVTLRSQLPVKFIALWQTYLLVYILLIIILKNDLQVAEAAASGKDHPQVIKRIKVIGTLYLKIQCHLCTQWKTIKSCSP